MKVGDKILIEPSEELIEMSLMDLAGREGFISEICLNRYGMIHGAWIELCGDPYCKEYEWFIPLASIRGENIPNN